ncbi:hypothetical protein RvY_04948 [Ramazzottius varieornatus]|uniref:Peptidase metallopeptidase domain-containing protein n=1 Tax=Ramazzottius varieornatus TaxID=947166 RepID=A0A1D1V018_RAMVA|nr:hypothetical protein RvY_04948 [Ramazzottius varieornatus]
MFLSVLGVLLLVEHYQLATGYVLNNDPQYQKWPGGKIPFYIPPNQYSQAELSMIGQAMQKMKSDTGGCIEFQQLTSPPTPGSMKFVTLTKAGGTTGPPSPTCYAFPGMVTAQTGQGQQMSLQGGPSGCMNNPRQVMRLLASLTGLRSEHNKPNRDQFVQVNQQAVDPRAQPYVPLQVFDQSKVLSNPDDFDFNSITLIDQTQFSTNGAPVIQSKSKPIQNSGSLSMKDCQAITQFYGCSATCQDPYGAGGLQGMGMQNGQGPFSPNVGGNGFSNGMNGGLPNQQPTNQFGTQTGQGPFTPNMPNGQQTGQIPSVPLNNGQFPNGQFPNGQLPNGQFPNGQFPNGQANSQTNGQFPTGQIPNGQSLPFNQFPVNQQPSGQFPTGQIPNGQSLPSNQFPANQQPSGQFPSGQFPSGQFPTGQIPTGQIPTGQLPFNQNQNPNQVPNSNLNNNQFPTFQPGQFQPGTNNQFPNNGNQSPNGNQIPNQGQFPNGGTNPFSPNITPNGQQNPFGSGNSNGQIPGNPSTGAQLPLGDFGKR